MEKMLKVIDEAIERRRKPLKEKVDKFLKGYYHCLNGGKYTDLSSALEKVGFQKAEWHRTKLILEASEKAACYFEEQGESYWEIYDIATEYIRQKNKEKSNA